MRADTSRSLTVAVAQFAPVKGNLSANLAQVRAILAQVDRLEPRPELLVFPETTLSGYFVEGGVRDLALTAGALTRELARMYREVAIRKPPLEVVIGFYETWNSTLYNSAMSVVLGTTPHGLIQHVHRKNFLPTYGMFDEERFVEKGHDIRAYRTSWGKGAILVCEDAWHSLSGTIAALDGAQIVIVCSAAPTRGVWPRDDGVPGPSSVARWERLVRDIAEEHGVYCVLANLVGSEGGKTFGGASTIVGPRGDVRLRAPVFDDAIVTLTLDLGDVDRARADAPMLADLRNELPHLLRNIDRAGAGAVAAMRAGVDYDDSPDPGAVALDGTLQREAGGIDRSDRASSESGAGDVAGMAGPSGAAWPVVSLPPQEHGTPPSLSVDAAMLEAWLTRFLRDEFARRGFTKAVVGLSGGVDSAVTAHLAARALGRANVIGIRMPYRTSSKDSLVHAQLVIDQLRIDERTVEISDAVDGYLKQEPDADAARRGNVMARTRMIVLFDLSAKHHALPLGTGNKTERLLGYFTWHADDSPPVNALGDLFKTQVWALARHLGVPEAIVNKPASADLISGQTDEGDFGISYAKADVILNWLLNGFSPADLVTRGFDASDVELVRKRLDGTHWKRRLPTSALVSGTAIGESYLRPVDY